jgi:putative DNA-invertase from lambdoid prophage Rac
MIICLYSQVFMSAKDRARQQGHRIGRTREQTAGVFNDSLGAILEHPRLGDISRRRVAKELGIDYATLKRLLDKERL